MTDQDFFEEALRSSEGGREGRWMRGKSMAAERSVELELYQEEGRDILTNTTTKVSKDI